MKKRTPVRQNASAFWAEQRFGPIFPGAPIDQGVTPFRAWPFDLWLADRKGASEHGYSGICVASWLWKPRRIETVIRYSTNWRPRFLDLAQICSNLTTNRDKNAMGTNVESGCSCQFIGYQFGYPNHHAASAIFNENDGVSCFHDPVWVPVGIKGRNPATNEPPVREEWEIIGGMFATGWDGDVVVAAQPNGSFSLLVGHDGDMFDPRCTCN